MLQVGRIVVGTCWRKVGIYGVMGVWESIRMEVTRDPLLLKFVRRDNVFVYGEVRGEILSIAVTCGCWSKFVALFVQSSCVIVIIVVELWLLCAASHAHFIMSGSRSRVVIWAYP